MLYALYLYLWRANMIRKREGGPYDSRTFSFDVFYRICEETMMSIDEVKE
jgi:hypothetical protein